MKKLALSLAIMLLAVYVSDAYAISLWERHCAACHDGKTVLNNKVVTDKEQIKAKYATIEDLTKAVTCDGPPCMNILKHDETLIKKVGKELGLKSGQKK
jgi:hypothetical protein